MTEVKADRVNWGEGGGQEVKQRVGHSKENSARSPHNCQETYLWQLAILSFSTASLASLQEDLFLDDCFHGLATVWLSIDCE